MLFQVLPSYLRTSLLRVHNSVKAIHETRQQVHDVKNAMQHLLLDNQHRKQKVGVIYVSIFKRSGGVTKRTPQSGVRFGRTSSDHGIRSDKVGQCRAMSDKVGQNHFSHIRGTQILLGWLCSKITYGCSDSMSGKIPVPAFLQFQSKSKHNHDYSDLMMR